MTRSAWLRYLWLWLAPTLLAAVNAAWLFSLRGLVLGKGASVVDQVRAKEQQVRELERSLRELEATHQALKQLQQQLARLRLEEMGPMREQLLPFLQAVGERTRQAGLFPERISYVAREEKKSGLVHFAATFELAGSYEQLRQCIAGLEHVPQFLVIERLGLQGEDTARSTNIAMQMVVGTYFSDLDRQLLQQLGATEEARAAF